METVTTVSLVGLAVAASLCLVRLLRPGSLADRMVALDTLLIVSAMGVAVLAVRTGTGAFTTVLLIISLLAFVGTVSVAWFIDRRGA